MAILAYKKTFIHYQLHGPKLTILGKVYRAERSWQSFDEYIRLSTEVNCHNKYSNENI